MEPEINKSIVQKIITFTNNSENVQVMIELIKMSIPQEQLVGDTEYATIVNAVKFDTRQNLILDIIKKVDFIKGGGLNQVEL